jgi:hypothetical protein
MEISSPLAVVGGDADMDKNGDKELRKRRGQKKSVCYLSPKGRGKTASQ